MFIDMLETFHTLGMSNVYKYVGNISLQHIHTLGMSNVYYLMKGLTISCAGLQHR